MRVCQDRLRRPTQHEVDEGRMAIVEKLSIDALAIAEIFINMSSGERKKIVKLCLTKKESHTSRM
jgi:hypothetical protein